MKLITDEQRTRMLANNKPYESHPHFDPVPVVKIFSPVGAATWLPCSLDRGCRVASWMENGAGIHRYCPLEREIRSAIFSIMQQ